MSVAAHPQDGILLRLYSPETQGTSFSLDGFPALKEGKSWQARLAEFIEQKGALGMTTNQTLFRQLVDTGILDERLRSFRAEGRGTEEIYQTLYNEAALEAARLFSGTHACWPCEGRVSQEASALLTEADPLAREVQRIGRAMRQVGAFTKIPNLPVGPQVIRRVVADPSSDLSPNVTLVFSDRHYLDTVEGYLLGLKELADRLKAQGQPESEVRQKLGRIHSVNSLFVSRVDRVADPMIEEALRAVRPESVEGRMLQLLKGKVAIAQAKIVYRIFEAVFLNKPFEDPEGLYADEQGREMLAKIESLRSLFSSLQPLGANRQRLLIASSGVKSDRPYSPLLYVLPFLGPWCANTMPEGTFEAAVRFVSGLPEQAAAALKKRSLISEPLPAIPTDISSSVPGTETVPGADWDRAILMTSEERRRAGIEEVSPDRLLKESHRLIFTSRGTTLRAICDTLRDKGAESFTSDEKATLQALETKLSKL